MSEAVSGGEGGSGGAEGVGGGVRGGGLHQDTALTGPWCLTPKTMGAWDPISYTPTRPSWQPKPRNPGHGAKGKIGIQTKSGDKQDVWKELRRIQRQVDKDEKGGK